MAFLGPASTTAASGASGNIARGAFTSTVSYGIKKTTGKLPIEHAVSYAEEKKPEVKKEPCLSFAQKTNSKICAIVKKQLNLTKSKILKSRIESTSFILSQIKERNIKIKSFVSASGISAYKDSLTNVSSEDHGVNIPSSFINQVVIKWESKVRDYEKILPEISFSILRVGLVLSNSGGLFKISKNLSKLFLLSPLGIGNQWQSWIHIDDASIIFLRLIEDDKKGIFNLVSPKPIIQEDLLKKIALFNNSKIIFPNIPAFIVKVIFGEMSELVLSSQKVRSNKLKDYNFKFSNIDEAIKDLSKKI